ncbi:MAG TPA: ABC transporter substrate-binding protein [Stellaceae bacterium]|nr:ABC transporter substrate-binding protein [Stellaceae bacterium]
MTFFCAGVWPASAQQNADPVVLGMAVSIADAPYYVADAKGYLAAEHIAADASNYRGAQDAVSALATGQMDVSMGAINAGFFNAANQGLDLRVVATLGIQPLPVTATPLLARKDLWDSGAIKNGADLKGRTVAVNTPGASPEYFLSLILGKYGMTLKDVNETMISFPEMVVALSNKAVDAAIPAEPFATLSIRQGFAELVKPDAGAGGGDMTTVFFFSGKFLRERPQVGERFLRAMIRGARDSIDYRSKPEIVAILAKATKLTADIVTSAYPYGFDPDLDIAKYEASVRRQERRHMLDGRLNYATPVPADRIFDANIVHRAAASLK